ncbi:uncharacterized protein LOC129757155 [Uranotaenia lowii]|uniref:uncharacterized protein LOC129757155 n=1 Tax=Uranotaenia lowii TaxID=190385 RepID=UPI0024789968|nr:uncharacterized protein LOC129757155 [Uranotaenia lowii]
MKVFLCLTVLSVAVTHLQASQLPPKVVEARDGLKNELHSMAQMLPNGIEGLKIADHHLSDDLHGVFEDFLTQNRASIDTVLQILQLVDHEIGNVIPGCQELWSLQEAVTSNGNLVYEQVTKPLVNSVSQLCQAVSESRLIDVEQLMERVEQAADHYRVAIDRVLQEIQIVSSELDQDRITAHISLNMDKVRSRLNEINGTLLRDMDRNFTSFIAGWIRKQKEFTSLLPEFATDWEEVEQVSAFMRSLDNETGVLQDELEEFIEDWIEILDLVLESVHNVSIQVRQLFLDEPLEDFLDGSTDLTCVAESIKFVDKYSFSLVDDFFRCVDFEDDMMRSYRQITSMLTSTDKAVSFIFESYKKCASMEQMFPDSLVACIDELGHFLNETENFVQLKANEIYFHVEDAMIFNEVTIEACLQMEVRKAVLEIADRTLRYNECKTRYAEEMLP